MEEDAHRPVVILGAGRHGRNVADVFRWMGRPILGFLDDTKAPGTRVVDIEILGGFDMARDGELLRSAALHVAIGNSIIRKELIEALLARGGALASAIHPSTAISPYAEVGGGLFVAPYVRVGSGARIGAGCILDPYSTIGTEGDLGAYVMLAAHCSLIAGSRIGTGAFLGTHASILGVSVGARCIVGAGSVVRRDLPDDVQAFGTPAKIVGPADWSRPPV